MKKTVLTFGLLSGAILSLMMVLTIPFMDRIGFERGEIIGYTSMVVAFLLIFFGVRQYRAQFGGTLGFARAFGVGAMIAGVASICYVATWQVVYHKVAPDFGTKYQAYQLEKARADGATETEIAQKKAELDEFWAMYRNPLVNVALTLIEPLPVGLFIALMSAAVLSRRRKPEEGGDVMAARVRA
ncbi:MAG TPA: DUF4199 domain-containing protein [Candidatus Paceibacterota bacterium]|nr:DUF4199 domain-containing protein [Candidatus Paceibacterota bacterium]